MSFNFQDFIKKLRENKQKKEVVEEYESYIHKITGNIKDQSWYQEYVSDFNSFPYEVPNNLKEDYDWDLLLQLAAASFSNDASYLLKDNKQHLRIDVKSRDQAVSKRVAILVNKQIERLFEIYIEEQMNLAILIAKDDDEKENEEDKNEKRAILAQRKSRLKRWEHQNKSIPIKKKVHEFENKILDYLETS